MKLLKIQAGWSFGEAQPPALAQSALPSKGCPLSGLIATALGLYSKQHQVESSCHFGDGHQRKADVLECRVLFRKDQIRKIEAYPVHRGKEAQRRQNSGDVPRLEKQIKEKAGAYAEKNTADVLRKA